MLSAMALAQMVGTTVLLLSGNVMVAGWQRLMAAT